ncbi:hypothetical protein KEM52_004787 [Ascosphaera acerosa]|nr:hypothetical protein KEM52_004787 [Ascosphaera acerosa]
MTQIDKLEQRSEVGGERTDAIDHCLAGISRLSKEVTEASSYVPAYHQKVYSDAIKALQDKLAEARARLAPRPRFAFRNAVRKQASAISLQDLEELNTQHARGLVQSKLRREEQQQEEQGQEEEDGDATPRASASVPTQLSSVDAGVGASGQAGKPPTRQDGASLTVTGKRDAFVTMSTAWTAPPSSSSSSSPSIPAAVSAYVTDIQASVIDLSAPPSHHIAIFP